MKDLVISGWVPYVGAMFGAWFGGLLAQNRIDSGWSVDKTRKFTITLGCLIMLPALLALSVASSAGLALTLMFIILFGFQTAIGNVQTLPSDFYGGKTVGTLAGLAGMAAKLAGAGIIALVPIMTTGGTTSPSSFSVRPWLSRRLLQFGSCAALFNLLNLAAHRRPTIEFEGK